MENLRKIGEIAKIVLGYILPAGTIVAGFYGFKSDVVKGTLTVSCLVAITILFYGYRAYRTFGSKESLPWPQRFWSLIFGRVSDSLGKDESHKTIRVLTISGTDEISTNLVSEISERLKSNDKFIHDNFVLNEKVSNEGKLKKLIRGADCIYLLWNETIKNAKWPRQNFEKWTRENSHKPALIADLIENEDYDFNVGSIKKEEAHLGLSLLLNKSIERGNAWRNTALSNRKYWFGTSAIFTVIIGCLGAIISVQNTSTQNLVESHQEKVQGIINQWSQESFVTFLDTFDVSQGLYNLSFWKTQVREKDTVFHEYSWTNNLDNSSCFRLNENSLIACSRTAPEIKYIWWQRAMQAGDTASWDYDGPTGLWNEAKKITLITDPSQAVCSFNTEDDKEDSFCFLCLSEFDDLSFGRGVCITALKRTRIDFLSSKAARDYLKNLLDLSRKFPMELIPEIREDVTCY